MDFCEEKLKTLRLTIKSDKFLELSHDAQLLYIHLWLAKPIGGVIANVYSTARMIGFSEDLSDLAISLLVETGFIEPVAPYGHRIYDTFEAEMRKDM